MNDTICQKLAKPYLQNLGYGKANVNINVLNSIMEYIDTNILHYEYKDLNDAINKIPVHSNYLINFIHIFSIYIDKCKSTSNYNYIKTFMCDNTCNLCKMYHVLASWEVGGSC